MNRTNKESQILAATCFNHYCSEGTVIAEIEAIHPPKCFKHCYIYNVFTHIWILEEDTIYRNVSV